jgi:anti-sigma factor RsiW
MGTLSSRVAALEEHSRQRSKGSHAQRLKSARERFRAMSDAEREAARRARVERWLARKQPEPGSLAWQLWSAARREAVELGLLPRVERPEP